MAAQRKLFGMFAAGVCLGAAAAIGVTLALGASTFLEAFLIGGGLGGLAAIALSVLRGY